MNARIVSGCAAALFILGGTVALLSADAPRAIAQAQLDPAPAPAAQVRWSPRPPGVPPDRWIPISANVGIVIVRGSPEAIQPRGPFPPSLTGYFAVHHDGRWWRLLSTGGFVMPLGSRPQD